MFRPIPAPRRRLPPTPGHMTGVGEAILQNPAIDYDTHRSPRMLPQVPGDHGKYSDYYDSDYTQDYQQYYANQPVYYQPIQGTHDFSAVFYSSPDSEPYYNYYDGQYDDSQSDQTITEYHENHESVGFHKSRDHMVSSCGEIHKKRYLGQISDERIFASNESRSDHSSDISPI